uniref:Uncharacterized protein n=1 Tax=Kuenenia stuttgartiensis TaxID=174633 RepID=Q1Q6Y4_KUEST|nr:unknown protein [Candidatus Kuenenia stuttgartiensis]
MILSLFRYCVDEIFSNNHAYQHTIHFVALHTITQILHKNAFPKLFILSLPSLYVVLFFMMILHYFAGYTLYKAYGSFLRISAGVPAKYWRIIFLF